jgi:L-alanine-DL-glutamate epimerase-like enolase superfamily enzyme
LLTGPCTNDPYLSRCRKLRSAAFIEVHTDTDLIGIGETYAGYHFPEVVPEIVEFFRPILVGQDVSDISELWRRMYQCGNYWCRVGLGLVVMSGVEAALWDLKGKMHGVPVHELLGGRLHDKLPCYATGGPSNYPKNELAAKIDHYLSLGFKAFKIGAGSHSESEGWFMPEGLDAAIEYEAEKIEFVRNHVGPEIGIMMDGHMGSSVAHTWDYDTAIGVLKALEPFDLFFFEEPLHYSDPWGYAELCKNTSVPIAGGECLAGIYEWRIFAERNSFDIAQPDASYIGGLEEFVKVADMFAHSNCKIATHAWGSGGALMQNIHCGFACANTAILEVPPDYAGLHHEIIGDSFVMLDGSVLPPEKPGLGIVLTDEIKNKYPFQRGSGEFISVPGKILTT